MSYREAILRSIAAIISLRSWIIRWVFAPRATEIRVRSMASSLVREISSGSFSASRRAIFFRLSSAGSRIRGAGPGAGAGAGAGTAGGAATGGVTTGGGGAGGGGMTTAGAAGGATTAGAATGAAAGARLGPKAFFLEVRRSGHRWHSW